MPNEQKIRKDSLNVEWRVFSLILSSEQLCEAAGNTIRENFQSSERELGNKVTFKTWRKAFHSDTDITEKKQHEKSTRLSRLYRVLGKINEAIVRIREPQKLFEEACRVAVEDGQFELAWIGLVDHDTKRIQTVAKYGHDEGYLDCVHISMDKYTPEELGPGSIALREGRGVVNNDTENNPEIKPWRNEQLKRGYRALACFPLIIENQTIGTICLYANKANYFDDEEIQLLKTLSADISFAIESADIKRQRSQAIEDLRRARAELDAQRKTNEKEMARLESLNLIGEMAAGIGHEIRNPMTAVRGFLQILGSKEECVKYKEYFDLMIEELDRANSIISEFLTLARNKIMKKKLFNLNDEIKTLLPLMQSDAMKSDKYIILELEEIPDLMMDEKEIRQVILNLVRNGLEASPTGSNLIISTFMVDDEVVLAIKDSGKGINPNVLGKLGTPFFTTKDNGTGLGLAVCYSIAARHKAKIQIETGKNGTTFYFRLRQFQQNCNIQIT